jgi:glutathione synthase/RimK-type ligase-like ATP-grasp enzyme
VTAVAVRVALATSASWHELDEDGPAMIAALDEIGVVATPEIWVAPGLDWSVFDLVVIRATWDYAVRREEFLAWTRRVPRLANPHGVIAWNTDKAYLRDLAAAGVATIPTRWCWPGAPIELPPGEIVVKPSVGAGGRGSGRYGPRDRTAARNHVERLLAEGRTVMVQPYYGSVESAGERGLVYLGDRYSHTIAKPSLLSRRGSYAGSGPSADAVRPATPTEHQHACAEAALAAIPGGQRNLLYARVDLVPDVRGNPVVIELEVTEPRLYLGCAPGSPAVFAAAVSDSLTRAWGEREGPGETAARVGTATRRRFPSR